MPEGRPYPALDHLVGAYLHQDYDVVHGSEQAAIAAFAEVEAPEEVRAALEEIAGFRRENAGRLHAAFLDRYRAHLDPGPDDAAVEEFLSDVEAILSGLRPR